MSPYKWFTLIVLAGFLVLPACQASPTDKTAPNANLPNPASVFCEQNGGELEIRTDKNGGQYGVCVFADKSECDEWAFFRGECKPGFSLKQSTSANLPNPASAFCEKNGGKLEVRTDKNGAQYGMCVFADKSECDEWAFFRGECKPGDSLKQSTAANLPNPASQFCAQNGGTLRIRTASDGSQYGACEFSDGSVCDEWAFYRGQCKPGDSLKKSEATPQAWKVYRNAAFGYTFQYPADAVVEVNADGVSESVIGPLVNNEHWPVIVFSHPQIAEYKPPKGADLEQWMKNNNLLMGPRLADVQVAGQTAIHLRQNTGPQAYNADRFFFTYGDQLYVVLFGHTGGKEDWTLYNRFLAGISFEK